MIIRSISDKKCQKEIPLFEIQQISNQQVQQQPATGAFPIQPQPQSIPQPQIYPLEIPTEFLANRILKDVTSKIELIYNTPAVEKLIKISEKKWYQLF